MNSVTTDLLLHPLNESGLLKLAKGKKNNYLLKILMDNGIIIISGN